MEEKGRRKGHQGNWKIQLKEKETNKEAKDDPQQKENGE
jgi:hypothetical protein